MALLIGVTSLFFNRFPEKTFKELAPYHRLTDQELSRENFTIEKINLDYNLHEIGIYANCNNISSHQILATLSDYLNQTLNAVSQSLEQRKISLLRVKFYPKTINYEGEHHEFKAQISTVISMFMGEELYGSKKVFIRELLQNARDAVLLRKAILEKRGVDDYEPRIDFELDTNKNILICRDNGVGMDYYSIKKYLSDVGRSFYTSEDYKNMVIGKENSPVSRFGIGLLSCFMVASKVIIRTKMENNSGYKIEIPSRGAFFFVEKDETINFTGTELKLELKPELENQKRHWLNQTNIVKWDYLDYGVYLMFEDDYVHVYKNNLLKELLKSSGRKWKLPRLVSSYAMNLPIKIYVKHDNLLSYLKPHRLIDKFRGIKINTNSINGVLDIDADMGSRIISGGIYVSKVTTHSLKDLGLPNYDNFFLDISPRNCNLNMARNRIIDFEKLPVKEKRKNWDFLSETMKKLGNEIGANFNLQNEKKLIEFIWKFPVQGRSLGIELLKSFYKVFVIKNIDEEYCLKILSLDGFNRQLKNSNLVELNYSQDIATLFFNDDGESMQEKTYVLNSRLKSIYKYHYKSNLNIDECVSFYDFSTEAKSLQENNKYNFYIYQLTKKEKEAKAELFSLIKGVTNHGSLDKWNKIQGFSLLIQEIDKIKKEQMALIKKLKKT